MRSEFKWLPASEDTNNLIIIGTNSDFLVPDTPTHVTKADCHMSGCVQYAEL